MKYEIALLKGDGIGPEIVDGAVAVLKAIEKKYNHNFVFTEYPIGGAAYDLCGEPLPQKTIDGCLSSDGILLGAVGGPKWDNIPPHLRPEQALLGIRAACGLYINLRPAKVYNSLKENCPLKEELISSGVDIMIVRELIGGIYFGERGRSSDGNKAFDTESYSRFEVERIGRAAFDIARKRRKCLHSVDKANVLESSRLWRETMHDLAKEYPDVEYHDLYVDNAAMQLIKNPTQFDVIVTSNMFGDILSDEASQISGSIGLLPSASLGGGVGMYEPIHGSAPDIAGKNIANPIATILSAAMMLRYAFNLEEEALCIENAVNITLESGFCTFDMASTDTKYITCSEMTKKIIFNLEGIINER